MGYYQENKKKVSKILFWTFLGIGVMFVGIYFLVTSRLLHSGRFIAVETLDMKKVDVVVALFQETSNSEDDGTVLEGYELRTYEKGKAEPIDKFFFKRSLNFLPADPAMRMLSNGTVWVFEKTDGFNSRAPFLCKFTISDDGKIKSDSLPALKGYNLGSFMGQTHLTLTNKFNEASCFDMIKQELKEGACAWEDDTRVFKDLVFLVKKTQESTRCKAYLFQPDSMPKPQGITITIDNGNGSASMPDLSNEISNYNHSTTEERFIYYQSLGDKLKGKIIPLYVKDYLISPLVVFEDEELALVSTGTSPGKDLKYYGFDKSGKMRWEFSCPAIGKQQDAAGISIRRKGKELLMFSESFFAFGLDVQSGKINWQIVP